MNPFERIFRALNKARVKYMVVGGVAVNLYGFMRFTGDIDLVVLLNEENLARCERVMHRLAGIKIPVISISDLIRMKKKAYRARDLEDLKVLLDLKGL